MSQTGASARIIVAGTGPAGLVAALGLASAGFAVTLAGPQPRDDGRTTALMLPALDVVERFGASVRDLPGAAPLAVMRIVDGTKRLIRSPVVSFRASEIGEDYFGLNVPNRELNSALAAAVGAQPSIDWRRSLVVDWSLESRRVVARLADGAVVVAELAVAADGRSSPAREAAGIPFPARALPQAALVLDFSHEREHGGISTELHTETGPFTQVPLRGRRSGLVWVEKPDRAAELSALDDEALSRCVEDRMQSMLGRVAVETGGQVYPLASALATRFAANRVALVGEAGHVFPPIGAQGMNLAVRDIRDLVDVASADRADPGAPGPLWAYHRRRLPDVMSRSGAVNALNMSLLSDLLPLQIGRSAALGLLGNLPGLRALFMREGLQPRSGLAALFASREEVRR